MIITRELINLKALNCEISKASDEMLKKLQNIKRKQVNGEYDVSYSHSIYSKPINGEYGRIYPNYISVCNLPRAVRGRLLGPKWGELDVSNCHPKLLKITAAKLNIPTPILDDYIKNRPAYIKNNFKFKTEMLSMICGRAPDLDKLAFGEEIKTIHNAMCQGPEYDAFAFVKRKGGSDSKKLSYVSRVFQNMEFKIMMSMLEYLKDSNIIDDKNTCLLLHDGVWLPRDKLDEQIKIFGSKIFDHISDHIFKHTGYRVSVALKANNPKYPANYRSFESEHLELPDGFKLNNWNQPASDAITQAIHKHTGFNGCVSKYKHEHIEVHIDEGDALGRLSPFPSHNNNLFVVSYMGSGKTHQEIPIINKHIKIVIASPKKSFTNTMLDRLNQSITGCPFRSYESYPDGPIKNPDRIIIQCESLHRLRFDGQVPTLFIMDEGTSVIAQMYSPNHRGKQCENIATLRYLIKYADNTMYMDANMDAPFIDTIMEIQKSAVNEEIQHRENILTYLEAPKDVRTSFITDRASMDMYIKNNVLTKKLFITTSYGPSEIESIKKLMIEAGESEDEIEIIHGETSDKDKKRIFGNPNKVWVKKKHMIVSPTLTAGVDFTIPDHFDNTLGIFHNKSITYGLARQNMRRVRNPISYTLVSFENKGFGYSAPTNFKDMKDHILRRGAVLSNASNAGITDYDMYHTPITSDKVLLNMRVRHEVSVSQSTQFFLSNYVRDEVRSGTRCVLVKYDGDTKQIRKDMKEFRKVVKKNKATDVFTSKTIDNKTADIIDKKTSKCVDVSNNESLALKKWKLSRMYGKAPDSADWVLEYDKPKNKNIWFNVRRFVNAYPHESTTQERLDAIREQDLHITATKGLNGLMSCKSSHHDIANHIISLIGVVDIWDPENLDHIVKNDFTITRIQLRGKIPLINAWLLSDIHDTSRIRYICNLFNKRLRKDIKANGFESVKGLLGFINSIIVMYGLSLIRQRKSGKAKDSDIYMLGNITNKLFTYDPKDTTKPCITYEVPELIPEKVIKWIYNKITYLERIDHGFRAVELDEGDLEDDSDEAYDNFVHMHIVSAIIKGSSYKHSYISRVMKSDDYINYRC